VARVDAEHLEVRAPERARRVEVEDARDADADFLALRGVLRRAALEVALDRLVANGAEQRPLDDDVVDRRAVLRQRRGLEEALERELGLVVDEVRVLLHARLTLLVELLQRVHVLDGALLAGEAADVAGGLAVERLRVD